MGRNCTVPPGVRICGLVEPVDAISSLAEEWEVNEHALARRAALATIRSAEWLTAGQARDWIVETTLCQEWQAEKGLLRRIGAGLRVKVAHFEWRGAEDPENRVEASNAELPAIEVFLNQRFKWLIREVVTAEQGVDLTECWPSGDFGASVVGGQYGGRDEAEVVGLRINREALMEAFNLPAPAAEPLPPAVPINQREAEGDTRHKPVGGQGGRQPASWWPDFAEELAVCVHDEGIPPGQGAAGQSELFRKICERLVERGIGEPGRATVQSVLSNVLKRCRPAGN